MNGRGADLTGKVVVMGEQRNGRASALAFAEAGCRVVLAARRRHALEQTADLCRSRGRVAHVVTIDVTVDGDLALPAR
jgi:NADP-dependent 3-hydroxy acid dehydrogenase YdfG